MRVVYEQTIIEKIREIAEKANRKIEKVFLDENEWEQLVREESVVGFRIGVPSYWHGHMHFIHIMQEGCDEH